MGSSVGIYLKNGTLQAAHLAGTSRRPRLKAVVEAGWSSEQQVLSEWLAERRLPGRQVTVAIPSRLVSVRRTSLPLTHLPQIRRTIKFHAERLIPGITPEDVLVDFLVTRKADDYTEMLLFVVRKADLASHVESLRLKGVEVEAITVDVIALFNLLAFSQAFDGVNLAAVVDHAGEGMNILLVEQGQLKAFRKLPAAPEAVASERVARELSYALTSAGYADPVERVILTGTVLDGLDLATFEERLACDVRVFAPPRSLQASKQKGHETAVRMTPVPAGTALEGLGHALVSVNFRRANTAYQTPYEIARKPLLLAAVLLVGWIGVELVGAMQASSDATAYLARLHGHAKSLFSKVVRGKKPKFSSTFHKTIGAVAKQRSGSDSAEKGWNSFLDFLKVLTEHLPTDTRNMIQSVNFRGDKAIVRGEAQDVDSFEALARGLEQSGMFEVRTPFRIRSGRRNRPAMLSFTIELSPRRK